LGDAEIAQMTMRRFDGVCPTVKSFFLGPLMDALAVSLGSDMMIVSLNIDKTGAELARRTKESSLYAD
jgi:hypothetical protein